MHLWAFLHLKTTLKTWIPPVWGMKRTACNPDGWIFVHVLHVWGCARVHNAGFPSYVIQPNMRLELLGHLVRLLR
jgi:hypothetical protein